MGWNILSFTGFTYEDIVNGDNFATPEMKDFIHSVDMLVDGPFILAKRDISLKFRGSSNQRLLHLKDGEVTSIE